MRYAIVKDGVCVNTIVAGASFAAKIGAVEIPDEFYMGDFFDGENWIKKEPEPIPEPEPEPETTETITDAEMAAAILEGVNGI